MGLIKAFATVGIIKDDWHEFFACDSMSNDALVKCGEKFTKGSNKGSTEMLTNGSVISINEGQTALIVSDGKIVEFSAEPGKYKWDASSAPSLLCGTSAWLEDSFKKFGGKYIFSGDMGRIQRVCYVNVKEIVGNKFDTSSPVSYNDTRYKTLYVRYSGQYSFRIDDPVVFYSHALGKADKAYGRQALCNVITDEFMAAFMKAVSEFSKKEYGYDDVKLRHREFFGVISGLLSDKWRNERGIRLASVAVTGIFPDDKSRERIEVLESTSIHKVPVLAEREKPATEEKPSDIPDVIEVPETPSAMPEESITETVRDESVTEPDAVIAEENPTAEETVSAESIKESGDARDKAAPVTKRGWTCPGCGNACELNFCPECGEKRPDTSRECVCGYKSDKPFRFCPMCGLRQ